MAWSGWLPADRPAAATIVMAVGVGLLCGLLHAVYAVSYIGLAFPGALAPHLGSALGLGFLSSAVACIVAALVLRYPGGMSVVSPEATLVIGGVGLQYAEIVAPERLLPTMLATVALVTLATALLLSAMGRARLGYLMHYLPYPVVAGMIGGLGALLVFGGIELAVPGLGAAGGAALAESWREVAVTAGFGVVLCLLQYLRPSVLNIPGLVLAASVGFWLIADRGTAVEPWLLGLTAADGTAAPGLVWTQLTQVDWGAVAGAAPTLAMLVVFLAVVLLTDVATLELALGEQLDPDQALHAIGLANAASAGLGGFTSLMSITGTITAQRGRVPCRLVGVTAGLVTLGFWVAGPAPFDWVPAFVVGGLIVFVGLEFLGEWVILQWLRLNGPDRAILAAVVVGVGAAGFALGFVLGLLLGFVFFVVSYSRLPAIRHETTARYRFSHVDRPESERDRLRAEGDATLILELGGFLFFGSAWRVYARIRRRLEDREPAPLRAVLLDFSRVSGVDSSGWHNFRKIAELAEQRDFRVALTGLPPAIEHLLRRERVTGAHRPCVQVLKDLDHGLEWLEGAALERHGPPVGLAEVALGFDHGPHDAFHPDRLTRYAERCGFAAGAAVIRQGEVSDDIFILRAGSISILVDGPDGKRIRLRTAGPGTVVGEIAFILRRPRTAWAVADTPVTADRITRAAMGRMAADEPQLLLALQASILRGLARRVSDSTDLVVQLSR